MTLTRKHTSRLRTGGRRSSGTHCRRKVQRQGRYIHTAQRLEYRPAHQPVHQPDQCRIDKEHPPPLHLETADHTLPESLHESEQCRNHLAAASQLPDSQHTRHAEQDQPRKQPPDIRIEPARERLENLLLDETAETAPHRDHHRAENQYQCQYIPRALHDHCPEHLIVGSQVLFPVFRRS